jgi:hypothetical protein
MRKLLASTRLRGVVVAGVALTALASLAAPTPAHAWWRGGGFGVVIGLPPVVVAPPPVVYAPPPPAYYAPPVAYAPLAPHQPVWVPPFWNGTGWIPGHWA